MKSFGSLPKFCITASFTATAILISLGSNMGAQLALHWVVSGCGVLEYPKTTFLIVLTIIRRKWLCMCLTANKEIIIYSVTLKPCTRSIISLTAVYCSVGDANWDVPAK